MKRTTLKSENSEFNAKKMRAADDFNEELRAEVLEYNETATGDDIIHLSDNIMKWKMPVLTVAFAIPVGK